MDMEDVVAGGSAEMASLSDKIRTLSVLVKRRVAELNRGKEGDTEAVKLDRKEHNFQACAESLAKAIEEAEKRVEAGPPQPRAIIKKRRCAASEDEAMDLDPIPIPVEHANESSTDVVANVEAAEIAPQLRVTMPAFTVKPDRNRGEKPPRDLEFAEQDWGAGLRRWCEIPPHEDIEVHQDMRIMEAVNLRSGWTLTQVENLPETQYIPEQREVDVAVEPEHETLEDDVPAERQDSKPEPFNWKAFHSA